MGARVVNTFSSDHEEISPALNHLLFTTRTRLAQKQLSCCSGRTVFFPQLIFVFRGQTSLGLAEVLVWAAQTANRAVITTSC